MRERSGGGKTAEMIRCLRRWSYRILPKLKHAMQNNVRVRAKDQKGKDRKSKIPVKYHRPLAA